MSRLGMVKVRRVKFLIIKLSNFSKVPNFGKVEERTSSGTTSDLHYPNQYQLES